MKYYLRLVTILLSTAFVTGQGLAEEQRPLNHPFSRVELGNQAGEDCSFPYSPIHFCDERHLMAIKSAIETQTPNFDEHFILLPILERKEYFEHSLVAIDSKTGTVYPLPFDAYSGYVDKQGQVRHFGKLSYTLSSNKVCIDGSISAYREIDSGRLCWTFDGSKFVGHHTPYSDQ